MKKLIRLVAIVLLPVFIACDDQASENTTLKLSFKALNETLNLSNTTNNVSGEGFGIDTAVIILERIKLTGAATGTNEILLPGPYEIDLLTKKSAPDLPVTSIIPGIYTTLEAELYVPANRRYSIYISGTYTRDDNWWRFRYTSVQTGNFFVENQPGFEITENTTNNIWVIIDVIALFRGINFSSAVVDADKIIRINSTSNRFLAEIIENNFEGASIIDDKEKNDPENIDGNDDDDDDVDDDDDNGRDDDDDDDDNDRDDDDDDDNGRDDDDDDNGRDDNDDDDEGDDDDDDDGDDKGVVLGDNKNKFDTNKNKHDKNNNKNKNKNKNRGKKKGHN